MCIDHNSREKMQSGKHTEALVKQLGVRRWQLRNNKDQPIQGTAETHSSLPDL